MSLSRSGKRRNYSGRGGLRAGLGNLLYDSLPITIRNRKARVSAVLILITSNIAEAAVVRNFGLVASRCHGHGGDRQSKQTPIVSEIHRKPLETYLSRNLTFSFMFGAPEGGLSVHVIVVLPSLVCTSVCN